MTFSDGFLNWYIAYGTECMDRNSKGSWTAYGNRNVRYNDRKKANYIIWIVCRDERCENSMIMYHIDFKQ